jgi:prevent-host-death family protein
MRRTAQRACATRTRTRAQFAIEVLSHICYVRRMSDVASRDLRNNTRALLERVESGESITITVDGRPVATLVPAGRRQRFVARDQFVRDVLSRRADPALRAELRDLSPDTTDDLPLR